MKNGNPKGEGDTDLIWSRRVATIAVGTLQRATTVEIDLQPAEWEIITEIVTEEIYVRLTMGDRPPTQSKVLNG